MPEPHDLVAMTPFAAQLGIELLGRSVIVVQTEIRDDDGKPLIHTTQSQAVIASAA